MYTAEFGANAGTLRDEVNTGIEIITAEQEMIEQGWDTSRGPRSRRKKGGASGASEEKTTRDVIMDFHEFRHQSLTRFE
jgi:hypothetical protein